MINSFASLEFFQNIYTAHPWMVYVFICWVVFWKGISMWKAARKHQRVWFIVLLIINTMGLLEILYIFWFSRIGKKKEEIKSL